MSNVIQHSKWKFRLNTCKIFQFAKSLRSGKINSLKMWEYLHLIHLMLHLIKCLKIMCREEICVERGCKHWINLPTFYSDHRIKCSLYDNIGQGIQTPFFLIKIFSPLIMLKENKLYHFCVWTFLKFHCHFHLLLSRFFIIWGSLVFLWQLQSF